MQMKKIKVGSAVLALAAMVGTAPCGRTQTVSQAATPAPAGVPVAHPAPDPETIAVQLLNRVPDVDRGNLKAYWPEVEGRTKEQWMQALPRLAKVLSPGEARIVCSLHTDGRVTNVVFEQRSGNGALDRSALAAVTASAPYDAFPYGVSVNQVRVRFTFNYDEANGATLETSGNSVNRGKPPAGPVPKLAGTKPKGPVG
jgi:TonB family protein